MIKIFAIVSLAVICITCSVSYPNPETKVGQGEEKRAMPPPPPERPGGVGVEECKTFQFRYIVTENVLYTPQLRHIEVFLDERSFSEGNLKELFMHLSKQFPEPGDLTIVVNTNWQQLPNSSDCPGIGMTNTGMKWKDFDHHGAIFYRRDKRLYFRFNPDLKVKEEKTVLVDVPTKE